MSADPWIQLFVTITEEGLVYSCSEPLVRAVCTSLSGEAAELMSAQAHHPAWFRRLKQYNANRKNNEGKSDLLNWILL